MKSYVLFGIDKYRNPRLLCLIPAASVKDAARSLACSVTDVGKTADRHYSLYFEARQECAQLVIDDPAAFHEALAKGCNPDAPADVLAKLVASYAYGTDNIYRHYLIGTAPVIR
jgi:hypothetical protein